MNWRSLREDKLGLALVAVLVVLLLLAWGFGMSIRRPAPPGPGPVFMGIFLCTLGGLFAASYFYSERSFFLRALLGFATGFPWMNNRKMAFLIAFLCLLAGLLTISDALRPI